MEKKGKERVGNRERGKGVREERRERREESGEGGWGRGNMRQGGNEAEGRHGRKRRERKAEREVKSYAVLKIPLKCADWDNLICLVMSCFFL